MLKILPLLTDPASHGGNVEDSFDVIVPSLIGYGFSDRAIEKGMPPERIADLFARLMQELGYNRYALRGSDFGREVGVQLALAHPDTVIGLHIGGTNPFVDMEHLPQDLTEAEQRFIADVQLWGREEMAYATLHLTKPQTVAYGLNDSPVGLAAWMIEKFRKWSDSDGDVEKRFSRNELLTNITLYWVTQTINSSMRLYYETLRHPGKWGQVKVPRAALMSSKDMFSTPREWAERSGRYDRWTELQQGGHFLEWEEPELVAEDLRTFFRPLR